MADIRIRPVHAGDEAAWRAMFAAYLVFYKREPAEKIVSAVWSWLMDPAHEMEGLIAELDGIIVGFADVRRMPSPLRGADIGFLDDLFILPEARGHGVVEAIFARLSAMATERGWELIRWMTADDNYRARTVYDRVAKKAGWNMYELRPQA